MRISERSIGSASFRVCGVLKLKNSPVADARSRFGAFPDVPANAFDRPAVRPVGVRYAPGAPGRLHRAAQHGPFAARLDLAGAGMPPVGRPLVAPVHRHRPQAFRRRGQQHAVPGQELNGQTFAGFAHAERRRFLSRRGLHTRGGKQHGSHSGHAPNAHTVLPPNAEAASGEAASFHQVRCGIPRDPDGHGSSLTRMLRK